jgi:16S rRNA (guanine527-N7)-methyltransferase
VTAEEEEALRRALAQLSAAWKVPCDPSQAEQLARYVALLLLWTARINLTAADSPLQLATDHLPDSFALASRLADPAAVIDVGSGGGLPAIPLAVLRPALRVQLVEPIAKKVAFLRTAVRELALGQRMSIDARRAEGIADEKPGSFDVAISRATLTPPAWIALGSRLVRPGGRVFALLGSATPLADATLEARFRQAYLGGRRWLVELERTA